MKSSVYIDALTAMHTVDPARYQETRNYIGGSTRLSVYITRGVLTLPQLRTYLTEKYPTNQVYKLINELAWREYWQREWIARGDAIFGDIKSDQIGVESNDLPIAVINGSTGIDTLDKGIQQLYDTGYVDNHMRMWLSGLICNIGHTKWQKPAAWMYYHLLDGDPASNALSWQWISGTFSSKQYLPAQDNINKYTKTRQTGTFLDRTYEELAQIKTPAVFSKRDETVLVWDAPTSDAVVIDKSKPTLLYHIFWLNSQWHNELDANRVLVLDPKWFEKFPVSSKVTESIVRIAQEIPDMQVFVGHVENLTPHLGEKIYYMNHPNTNGWPGEAEHMPMLFPEVPMRSYNSFTGYWKQCEKFL